MVAMRTGVPEELEHLHPLAAFGGLRRNDEAVFPAGRELCRRTGAESQSQHPDGESKEAIEPVHIVSPGDEAMPALFTHLDERGVNAILLQSLACAVEFRNAGVR